MSDELPHVSKDYSRADIEALMLQLRDALDKAPENSEVVSVELPQATNAKLYDMEVRGLLNANIIRHLSRNLELFPAAPAEPLTEMEVLIIEISESSAEGNSSESADAQ